MPEKKKKESKDDSDIDNSEKDEWGDEDEDYLLGKE